MRVKTVYLFVDPIKIESLFLFSFDLKSDLITHIQFLDSILLDS